MDFKKILIFTDGACSGNPGPGGYGAVIVYPEGQVEELGDREDESTNNRMEMLAVIRALQKASSRKEKILLLTDSTYVIRGASQWLFGWKRKDWKNSEGKEISNKDLWQKLDRVLDSNLRKRLEWGYVRGHQGVPGNERCDEIAVHFSRKKYTELYRGDLLRYEVAVYDIPDDLSLPARKNHTSKTKKKAYCYLSMVDGEIKEHQTWPDCEARVKGRSGARFKKAMSPEEAEEIKASWK